MPKVAGIGSLIYKKWKTGTVFVMENGSNILNAAK